MQPQCHHRRFVEVREFTATPLGKARYACFKSSQVVENIKLSCVKYSDILQSQVVKRKGWIKRYLGYAKVMHANTSLEFGH